MIALARADARRFRAVARRGVAAGRPKGPSPPVRLTAAGERLTLACHLGQVVVALRTTTPQQCKGTVTISLSDLDAFEGPAGVVTLDATETGPVTVRWDAGPAPRTARLSAFESHRDWPAESDRLVALAPAFPKALHEAGRSAARDEGKYAVTRVQVRGAAGELCGTDGRHALAWGGFKFP